MEFMDPKRRRRYTAQLFIGYLLVGLAIALITLILLFVAYGFGYKNGQVIQNGLVFLSSTPNPAQVYLNGERYTSDTNTRLILPTGTYAVMLKRNGYRDWTRSITVQGSQVESFTYPFLFPSVLTTNTAKEYTAAPALTTQSDDGRWLLIAQPGLLTSFDVYDLGNVKKAPVVITLPLGLLTTPQSSQSIQVVGWADDNNHLLLRHTYDANAEYILLNRSNPVQSVNLTRTLGLPASGIELQLRNKHPDQYILYDTTAHTLSLLSQGNATPQVYLQGVLAFATYGDNMTLYATPDADPAKVAIYLYDNGNTYPIRTAAPGTTYLLDISQYSGDTYLAVAAQSEGVAYIYRNPESQIHDRQLGQAVPVQVFRIKNPTYVSFSPGSQYALFESGTNLAVYDAEQLTGFTYSLPDALDSPQARVAWMDSARLDYVSHGQVVVLDYDGSNRQTLVSAAGQYEPAFTPDQKYLYTFVPAATDKTHELLTLTPLRTPADM